MLKQQVTITLYDEPEYEDIEFEFTSIPSVGERLAFDGEVWGLLKNQTVEVKEIKQYLTRVGDRDYSQVVLYVEFVEGGA